MAKAKETELEKLHAEVAKILTKQVSAEMEMEIEGEAVLISTASPALLGQAIKFLKDNNITADPETDENLTELAEVLEKKRKQGRMRLVSPKQASGEEI